MFLFHSGLFLLRLFDDLHLVFANIYIHRLDSDHVLLCEVFIIAHQTAKLLPSSDLKTPKSDYFLENVMVDQNNNVHTVFEVNSEQHVITLSAKLADMQILHARNFYFFFSLS